MVLNLQKQVQEKDDALMDISDKLSRKSEECESLVEERDMMRSKSSFDLQQVTEDQDALQETLKKKDRYIQEIERRHNEEAMELKRELEELSNEHEIELEMLKKEMEDLKLREERWKRVAELKKDSDYDSSDVGSRDHSPEIEALKEQMASLQSNYEDEIIVLKEKLQSEIVKASEAADKVEQQEFELQENLSELKSAFESEKNALLTEHQTEMDELRRSYDEKTRGIETGTHSSMDVSEREQYENQIYQLQDQVTNLTNQLEANEAQMAQDILIMKSEFEAQLDGSRSGFESEKQRLKSVITELKNQAEDTNAKHSKDIEQMEEAFRREKEEIRNASHVNEDENDEAMRRKIEEYENEIKELKESLQNERLEFVEARESLESMIAEQEKEFEGKEEKLRAELNEEHQMKVDKVVSDYEQRLQEAERSYLEGKDVDGNRDRTNEELQLEIKSMKRLHERELERLHENLETQQAENENLKTEFDLVVTDLSSELESNKKPGKPPMKRRESLVLKEQIERLKGTQDQEIRLLVEDVVSYKQKVTELESEVQRLRSADEKKSEADIDLQTKTPEPEYELEVMRGKNSNNELELQEYKAKVSDLEKQLELRGSEQEHVEEQDENKISDLENQLDVLKKDQANSEAKVEQYKVTIETLRKDVEAVNDEKHRLDSEVQNNEEQIKNLTDKLKTTEAKFSEEVQSMQGKIANLQAEKQDISKTLEKQSGESESKIEELTKKLEQVENESKNSIDAHREKSEEVILGLHEKIEALTEDYTKVRKEKDLLQQELQDLGLGAIEGEDGKIAQYQQEIEKLSVKIESLENYRKQSEIEKQDLQEEIENLRYPQNVEPVISLAAVDETFLPNPAGLGLEYEQQMKGLAEDYEEKIEKLERELEEERSKSAAKTRRIESVNLEIEALRQNLEQERHSVNNSQERIIKMQEKHDEDLKNLKDQIALNAKNGETTFSSNEEAAKEQFLKTIKTLEADLETALQANREQVEYITELKTQLEVARHTNVTQEGEVTKLSKELAEFQQQQKAHEASITAEQLITSEGHAKLVGNLTADLEAERKLNQTQRNEINRLERELETFQQQQIAHEANLTAEQLRVSEGHAKEVTELKADLERAQKLNKTQQEEISELKQELEEFQQQQIAHEANLTAEQLKISESQKTQKQELKRKTKEITALKSELEDAQQTNRKQCDELARVKSELDELKNSRKRFEEDFLVEKFKADEASERKIKALEEEVRRKVEEMSKLFTVLDTEQKGRERVLMETEKHLTHMHQAEQEKINSERIIAELKNQNQALRSELSKEKEQFAAFVSQSKKAQSEEHEEVEKLSRSLTESEMDKGKLTDEMETCKEELNKMEEKYGKLKEKFLALKQKRKEEKEKYDEILLTPRFEMGLQTSLLEPEDLNQTKEQLSTSIREQGRLEDELESLQRDTYKKKSEIQALKRANEVLRKQNQVLYLETESLRRSGHRDDIDVSEIERQNEQLMKEKDNLEIENRYLKEALIEREKQDEEGKERDSLSDDLPGTELRDLKEKQARIEQENFKLHEENEFLLKQGKRLQFQVDQLEDEVQRLKRQTPLTSTPKVEAQSQPFVDELIRRESGTQLNVESLPGSFGGAPLNSSLEAQRFAEENQRIKEQIAVLQGRLRQKENELQNTNVSQTGEMEDLANERQVLLAQIDSMKEALEKDAEKGHSQKVTDWDANKRADTEKENLVSPTPFTQRTGQAPFTGFAVSNLQSFEFDVENYLGSAYWEATKFLDRLQQVS